MKRAIVAVCLVLGAAACSPTEGEQAPATESTVVSVVPSTAESTTTATAPLATTASGTDEDALATLERWVAALNAGQVDDAMGLMALDGLWSSSFFELPMDEPMPTELSWLPGTIGLPDTALGSDVLRAFLEHQSALRSVHEVSDCTLDVTTATCTYGITDALTPILGLAQGGGLGVVADHGAITELRIDIGDIDLPGDDQDAFLRWAMVAEPQVALDPGVFGDPDALVALADAWASAGRPDIAVPTDVGSVALDVISAWLDAREAGDWERHVALLGGDALSQEMGSRDDFEATALLERRIKLGDCTVTLESERVGVVIGCVVTVEDIITREVGAEPSNPNVSTFQVKDGRVTSLPEFIPSLFLAEEGLETWGAATYPDEYPRACPEGITNPLGIEDRTCAQFLVDHRGEWTVAAVDPYL